MPAVLICIVMSILALPEPAQAWGGGIHLQIGLNVLASLEGLPYHIAAVLAAHPRDYLYGCIAADITIGKKYTHYLLNCHRWGIGEKVLAKAACDSERACAWGYLSHLAADVIAHNYYVPYKLMRSFPTVTMKHAYWEMRFETFADKNVWDTAREVCTAGQGANDALLRRVLSNTIFSFGTNKRIFNSIMLLSRLERWQKVMLTLSNRSRYTLADSDRDEYLRLTGAAVTDFLQNGPAASCRRADPTGERALLTAEAVRRNMRLLYRSGRLSRDDGLEQVERLKGRLLDALERPDVLKELYSG